MKLEDRPLRFFKRGERIRLVNTEGISSWRLNHGMELGKEYTVKYCFSRMKQRRKETKVLLEGYPDWLFSTRRFDPASNLPEELFEI